MSHDNKTIIGIRIGTHAVGLIALQNNQLLDWRIKRYTGKWSKQKCRIITQSISKYANAYKADSLALYAPSGNSKGLSELLKAMDEFEKNFPIHRCSIHQLRTQGFVIKNKQELIPLISRKFPEVNLIKIKTQFKLIEALTAILFKNES